MTKNDLFQHKKRLFIANQFFCWKMSFLGNLIEYIIKLIYQSSNVWDEQMYHCIIFDLEWFLIRDYHYTGTSMYKVTWLSNMKPFERFSGWFCRFGTWFISSKTSHFWQKMINFSSPKYFCPKIVISKAKYPFFVSYFKSCIESVIFLLWLINSSRSFIFLVQNW